MIRRTTALALTALAAAAAPALAGPAQPAPLDRAEALADRWGRCPTARPAHTVLAAAQRPGPTPARAARARAALRAWTTVADDCRRPVPMPIVLR